MKLNEYSRTSLKQVPAMFKKIEWKPGTFNLDIGGGRFDDGTNYLKGKMVLSLVLDPHSRSQAHNDSVLGYLKSFSPDTITMANVLNVIESAVERHRLIEMAYETLKPKGKLYISVYEKDRSGIGARTSTGSFQANRSIHSFLAEIKEYLTYAPGANKRGSHTGFTSKVRDGVITIEKL